MGKEKVYKLAQEFRVSSEALVQMLKGMGIVVKSHMSTVDENLREAIRKKFEEQRAEIKKDYARKRQILDKKREELLAAAEAKEKKMKEESAVPVAEVHAPQPTLSPAPATHLPTPAPAVAKEQGPPPTVSPPAAARPTVGLRHRPSSRGMSQLTRHDRVFDATAAVATMAPGGESQHPFETARKGDKKAKKRAYDADKRDLQEVEIDEVELRANIKKTLAKISAGTVRRKYKKEMQKTGETDQPRKTLRVSEFVTVSELANMIQIPPAEVLAKCLEMGLFVTINQRLDFETIELVADEFGYAVELMEEYAVVEEEASQDAAPETLEPRAPVVTVMGHVDHGKTSLLDYIRKTNVIAGEAGGITQHIAAYEVLTSQGSVTFLDTPGHEAFTAMRARGSQVTDVIVLVVAADAGVMPQTKEAIDHARAANVPIVVAINKIDLPTANIEKVKAELAQYNVVPEDYGGQVPCIPISAKTGANVDKLLERLALETEMLELKATPVGPARGVVIEAELDKGRGAIATVLIKRGTLRRGDAFVVGIHYGKVRELLNERGQPIDSVGPSRPAVVLGLSGTPQAGDSFQVFADEKKAREIAARRRLAQKERELRRMGAVSLDYIYEQIKAGSVKTLNLIIKGDVDGSVEALADSLVKLSTDEVRVNVIHKSVGAIKEADIMLAAASRAIIVGFHLNPNSKIRELARREGVDIRTYRIIYEAVDAVRRAMEGMLAPEVREKVVGSLEVRQVFNISKIGPVAGCYVVSGAVTRGARVHVIRDDVEITETNVASLRRHKEDVREVAAGFECGLTLANFTDYREGDRIEVYEEVKVARSLDASAGAVTQRR